MVQIGQEINKDARVLHAWFKQAKPTYVLNQFHRYDINHDRIFVCQCGDVDFTYCGVDQSNDPTVQWTLFEWAVWI